MKYERWLICVWKKNLFFRSNIILIILRRYFPFSAIIYYVYSSFQILSWLVAQLNICFSTMLEINYRQNLFKNTVGSLWPAITSALYFSKSKPHCLHIIPIIVRISLKKKNRLLPCSVAIVLWYLQIRLFSKVKE